MHELVGRGHVPKGSCRNDDLVCMWLAELTTPEGMQLALVLLSSSTVMVMLEDFTVPRAWVKGYQRLKIAFNRPVANLYRYLYS